MNRPFMCVWFTKCEVKQFVIVPREHTKFTVDSIRMFGGHIDGRLSKRDTQGYEPFTVHRVREVA